MTTWFSATAIVPQLRADWHLSQFGSSLLTIGVQLGFVAGALASAVFNLSDLVPPRRLMVRCAFLAAVANLMLLSANGLAAALPLRFSTGLLLAGVYPPAVKAIATWFRRDRGTAIGIMVGALTVGSAIPHLVNALGGLAWQMVIIATSGLTILGGLLVMLFRDGPFPFPRALFDPRQIGLVMRERGVRLATFGYWGHMWELYAMWAWLAVFLSGLPALALREDGARLASLATFAAIGFGGLGCYVGGVLGDRWGRTSTTALAMVLSGFCAVVIGLARSSPIAVLAVAFVWGFWIIADSAQFSAIVTEVADQRYVGTAVTLQLAGGYILTVPTIWLIPVLHESLTWRWAFAVLAVGPALGIVAMLRLRSLPEARRISGGRG